MKDIFYTSEFRNNSNIVALASCTAAHRSIIGLEQCNPVLPSLTIPMCPAVNELRTGYLHVLN